MVISTTIDMSHKQNLNLFKALCEETRYRIVEILLEGERCACEIPLLTNKTQSNTSMQLAKLKKLGILKSRRDGKRILYSIEDPRVCDIFKALGNPKGRTLSPCCCMEDCK